MKTAIIFSRVSSVTDRQNTDRQIKDLERYSNSLDIVVKQTYTEKISGNTINIKRYILKECIEYCINNNIDIILISELSRLGRNVLEVQETIKVLVDNKINLYCQKEQFTLLDENKELTVFAPIMIATLATCAQIERENIKFRLNSGRQNYIDNGGKLGRNIGSVKSDKELLEQHSDIVKYLRKNYSIRETAKLVGKSPTTVSKIKKIISL